LATRSNLNGLAPVVRNTVIHHREGLALFQRFTVLPRGELSLKSFPQNVTIQRHERPAYVYTPASKMPF